jgi:hypothetical protein
MNIEKIKQHYNHAREKHRYFCDSLLPKDRSTDNIKGTIKKNLLAARADIAYSESNGCLIPQVLLNCEVWEINEAVANDNTTAAVEECYDAIAVLLRVVDVLEGRQALGKPKGGEPQKGCTK